MFRCRTFDQCILIMREMLWPPCAYILVGVIGDMHQSLNEIEFYQIPPLTSELAAPERLQIDVSTFFSEAIGPILFKLAGFKEMHKILDGFNFLPYPTNYSSVICPGVPEKYPIDLYLKLESDVSVLTCQLSRVVRNPAFCICENKGADQLCSICTADQRLCFRYMGSTIPLLSKPEISSI